MNGFLFPIFLRYFSGAQNRYAIRLADQSKVSPDFAGWDRLVIKEIFVVCDFGKDTVIGHAC